MVNPFEFCSIYFLTHGSSEGRKVIAIDLDVAMVNQHALRA